jgi:hypothetical protein
VTDTGKFLAAPFVFMPTNNSVDATDGFQTLLKGIQG